MKNMGGFARLSISFTVASGVIFAIGVGLSVWVFINFLIGFASPEIANQSEQLTAVILGFVLKFLLDIKLVIYAFVLMGFFSWLAWIFAGFAKNE
jgi:hypothetical protein